jgi:peptidoglycan/LPS O-acetylase OafA/YrhL
MDLANKSPAFRSDINGLRALAVLPVLFFHAGIPIFSGGFLGVDVFFVISGYLITKNLASNYVRGTFSILAFYDNRLRRIMPALLVVAACTTVLAPLFMLPYSLKNYGQSLVATMLSANNILLYLTSGYWSLAAEFKPLFHTWSLGVEDQYYFLAPLLLYFLYRQYRDRPTFILTIVTALLGASFLAALLVDNKGSFLAALLSNNKEFDFLSIVTRAWELAVGALLALAPNDGHGNSVLSTIGLLALLVSYVFPHSLGDNQGLVVAIPVLATGLIIRYSRADDVPGQLLSLKPLAWIGLISYSVYLWHQPILAFVRLSSAQPPRPLLLLACALLSLPLGYLSWRFIENPFRDKEAVSTRAFYSFVVVGVGASLLIGYTLNRTHGFQTLTPQYAYGENPQTYNLKVMEMRYTSFSHDGRYRVLVVGNSFARDYVNMLRENGYLSDLNVVYTEETCPHPTSATFASLAASSNLIVISQNWGHTIQDGEVSAVFACYQEIKKLSSGRVVVLGAKNFGWNNDFVKLVRGTLSDIRVAPLSEITTFNAEERALIGDDYIDIMDTIVDDAGKVPIFTPDEKFITYDSDHLTQAGARYIGSKIFRRYDFLVHAPAVLSVNKDG